MKRSLKYILCRLISPLLLLAVGLTSCNDGDDVDTNQYDSNIKLNVFGPSPVLRGGVLRFIGSGMNQVSAVVLQGCTPITDITVISDKEINITVPQDAQPGIVVLETPQGNIETRTELTFREPIVFESFSPQTVLPGEQVTIKGDYLNLIAEVVFPNEQKIKAENFLAQSRYEIQVIVPSAAQSGKIVLADGKENPNWIYAKEELTVTLPSVAQISELNDVKPLQAISLAGEHLNLIQKVLMPNGTEVEFSLSEDGSSLLFSLPEVISDGNIEVVVESGVKVVFATISVAKPENVVVSPLTELRGGDLLTIEGDNLELFSYAKFPHVSDQVALTAIEGGLQVEMPALAQSGVLTLYTANGSTTEVEIVTAKPVAESYNKDLISTNTELIISGQNLDLVKKVIFADKVPVEVAPTSATELSVIVPSKAQNGELVLEMANGESVGAPMLSIDKPVTAYILAAPDKLIKGNIYELAIENADRLVSVEMNGKGAQFVCDVPNSKLILKIPTDYSGMGTLKLISDNGEIEYAVDYADNEKVLWSGDLLISFSLSGTIPMQVEDFKSVTPGTIMRVTLVQLPGKWGQAYFSYGNGDGIVFSETISFTKVLYTEKIYGKVSEETTRVIDLVLDQTFCDSITQKEGGYCGTHSAMYIKGGGLRFQKVALVNK